MLYMILVDFYKDFASKNLHKHFRETQFLNELFNNWLSFKC